MKLTYFVLVVSIAVLASSSTIAKPRLDGIYTGVLFSDDIDRAKAEVSNIKAQFAKENGVGGTVVAGYAYESQGWILALEGDFSLQSSKEVWSDETWWGPLLTDAGYIPSDYTASTKFRRSLGFLARYGYTFGNSVFLYGSLGWVKSWLTTTVTNISDPAAPLAVKLHHNINGFRYGGGLELPISGGFSIRGDYLHTNYKNYVYTLTDGVSTYDVSVNPSADTFRLGLVYHW
ncbi:MAG TPA: outer membrane beta-barrel protein [Alphaproteobacteria bacterium]|nr:outer membrane beta-barrel protein [Alphaproteobacteria bacterium]